MTYAMSQTADAFGMAEMNGLEDVLARSTLAFQRFSAAWAMSLNSLSSDTLGARNSLAGLQSSLQEIVGSVDRVTAANQDDASAMAAQIDAIEGQSAALSQQAETYQSIAVKLAEVSAARLQQNTLDAESIRTQNGLTRAINEQVRAQDSLEKATKSEDSTTDPKKIVAASKEAADAVLVDWKKVGESLEKNLSDSLIKGFSSGKTAAQSLKDYTDQLFKSVILEPGAKWLSSGVDKLLASGVDALASGLFGDSVGAGDGAAAAGGQNKVGAAVTAVGSSMLGSSLSKLFASASASTGMLGTIGAALPYVGAALMIAQMFGAFDDAPENPRFTPYYGGAGKPEEGLSYKGITGTYGFSEAQGRDFAKAAMQYIQNLDKTAASLVGYDPVKLQGIRDQLAAVTTRSDGQPLEWAFPKLDGGASKEIATEFGKQIIGAALDQVNAGLGDYVREMGNQDYDKVLTTAGNFSTVITAFEHMGRSGSELSKALIDSAGGIALLATQTSAYYTNFYSESERAVQKRDDLRKQVADTFSKLNMPEPGDKDAFRALVSSLDLTTESGRATYTELMKVAEAFATLQTAGDQLKSGFVTNFYSAAEQSVYQRQNWRDQVTKVFDQYGMPVPTDKAGYRQAVESVDRSTEAGQSKYDALMQISSVFAQLQNASDALVTSYKKSFYSASELQGEQLQGLRKQVTEAFQEMGLAVPQSKEAFRHLVDSLDLSTDAGKSTYDALMLVASAFGTLQDTAAAVTNSINSTIGGIRHDLMSDDQRAAANVEAANAILNRYGMSVTADQFNNTSKNDALAIVDQLTPIIVASNNQQAANDLKTVENLYLENQKYGASSKAGREAANGPSFYSVPAGQLGSGGVAQAADDAARALKDLVSGLRSFESELLQGDLSALSPEAQYQAAFTRFGALRAASDQGDQKAAGQLRQAAEALLQTSRAYNGSGAAYGADFASVVAALDHWTQGVDEGGNAFRLLGSAMADPASASLASLAQSGYDTANVVPLTPRLATTMPSGLSATGDAPLVRQLDQVVQLLESLITQNGAASQGEIDQLGQVVEKLASIERRTRHERLDRQVNGA